ncbi:MAG: hypothetical protein WAM43_15800 [Terriglobales bacterium]
MLEQISITSLLAAYGAILSSVGLGWNLYRDLHDRARLKVIAHPRRIAQSALGDKVYAVAPRLPVVASEQLFVLMDVTNVGRRPVRWDGWGGKYYKPVNGKSSFLVVPKHLPKMLYEGESHCEFASDMVAGIENVKQMFVWDAAGKNWYLSRRNLKKLKEEIAASGAAQIAAATPP